MEEDNLEVCGPIDELHKSLFKKMVSMKYLEISVCSMYEDTRQSRKREG